MRSTDYPDLPMIDDQSEHVACPPRSVACQTDLNAAKKKVRTCVRKTLADIEAQTAFERRGPNAEERKGAFGKRSNLMPCTCAGASRGPGAPGRCLLTTELDLLVRQFGR